MHKLANGLVGWQPPPPSPPGLGLSALALLFKLYFCFSHLYFCIFVFSFRFQSHLPLWSVKVSILTLLFKLYFYFSQFLYFCIFVFQFSFINCISTFLSFSDLLPFYSPETRNNCLQKGFLFGDHHGVNQFSLQ